VQHREAQCRLEQLVPVEARSQAQHQPRHAPRQLAGQLGSAALEEQVHDGHVEVAPAHRDERSGAGAGQADPVARLAQERGQGAPATGIAVHEQDRSERHRRDCSKSRTSR
jgi:hypothetical protein